MRRWISNSFYRLIDSIPTRTRYQLTHTPILGIYRLASRALGSPVENGVHVIASGPLQGNKLFLGTENVRGYPSLREYLKGTYEPKVAEAIVQNCVSGTCVVDIGAHYGYFSLLMARAVGKEGRCIAIEANHSNYEKILRMKEANNVEQLQVEQLAITDHSGNVVFYNHINSLMGQIIENDYGNLEETETVPATTIDLFAVQKEISNLTFIKMDIEGAEGKAIAGGKSTIHKYRPTLLIEVHTFIPPDELARPLISDLLQMNYRVFYLESGEVVNLNTFIGGHILALPSN